MIAFNHKNNWHSCFKNSFMVQLEFGLLNLCTHEMSLYSFVNYSSIIAMLCMTVDSTDPKGVLYNYASLITKY